MTIIDVSPRFAERLRKIQMALIKKKRYVPSTIELTEYLSNQQKIFNAVMSLY